MQLRALIYDLNMPWRPATLDEVRAVIQKDLPDCNQNQAEIYRQNAVSPYPTPIIRSGKREFVIVVAKKSDEVLYWEDVEEGFNHSKVDAEGLILTPGWEQDTLNMALQRWLTQPSAVSRTAS